PSRREAAPLWIKLIGYTHRRQPVILVLTVFNPVEQCLGTELLGDGLLAPELCCVAPAPVIHQRVGTDIFFPERSTQQGGAMPMLALRIGFDASNFRGVFVNGIDSR